MTGRPFPIVFVHLGDRPAPHLLTSIQQARRAAPRSDIWAILSPNTVMAKGALGAGALVRLTSELSPTPQHRTYASSVRRRLGKKRGFWRFATERFFFLEELMASLDGGPALHVESDNLIFFDPNEILERLQSLYPGLAAPFAYDALCIPGIVYASGVDALAALTRYIADRIDAAANERVRWYRPRFLSRVRMGIKLHDMNLLADFRRERGTDALNILPMVPPSYPIRPPNTGSYSYGFSELGMIFDGLSFAYAIHGLDRANHPDGKGDTSQFDLYVVDHSDFDYAGIDFLAMPRHPYVMLAGERLRVASLHNHAKIPLTMSAG